MKKSQFHPLQELKVVLFMLITQTLPTHSTTPSSVLKTVINCKFSWLLNNAYTGAIEKDPDAAITSKRKLL
jgi:hypothetical protein